MKTGIIGAMDVEISYLKEQMHLQKVETIANMSFCEGCLGSSEIVVVKSGVGKVNAAICVQILIDHFHVTQIINTGVAGSLDNDINIGDIVVSTDAMYHDVDATVFGYELGEIPQMGIVSFPADKDLRKAAIRAIKEAAPNTGIFEGQVLSGDQFISDHKTKEDLMKNFHAKCAEMEGAAIAQASYLNHIPFVILRAISDKADESVKESYSKFEGKAARLCALIVCQMVSNFQ